jgi:ferredoxin-type protein NapF
LSGCSLFIQTMEPWVVKMTSVSRAQFLRGDFRGKSRVVRPPWSLAENLFVEACSRCGACIRACPEGILRSGRAGFPVVHFEFGECTFCGRCVEACRDGALHREGSKSIPWHLTVSIGDNCLAQAGIVCGACAEHCEAGAIRLRPTLGRVPQPYLHPSICTGCGACCRPCPVGALEFRAATKEEC